MGWVDDLLNLSWNSIANSARSDPTTAILDSAYGLNSSSAADPTTSILESACNAGASGSEATTVRSTCATSSVAHAPGSGNSGSRASVNVYA